MNARIFDPIAAEQTKMSPIRGLAYALAVLALTGCGDGGQLLTSSDGGGTVIQAVAPRSLRFASVEDCGAARVHDTGQLVYVIAPRDCATGSKKVSLIWGNSVYSEEHQLEVTDFGDQRSVTFETGNSRTVSVHRAGSWESFANQDSWDWRDGAGLLAKDGGLYLLGGWNDKGTKSEVWFTTDVEHWQQLTPKAPWGARHGAGWVVHQDRLYVVGGDLLDDVWSSPDGVNWQLHAEHAPFGGRYAPSAASDGESRLLFWGGQNNVDDPTCATGPLCGAIGYNDVWQSTSSGEDFLAGAEWSRVHNAAPWTGRALVHGGVFFEGRFYVVGGGLKAVTPSSFPYAETVAEYTDVWSSADGVDWRLEAEDLGIPPRTHFAILATDHGCYIANGSVVTQFNTSSEVFFAPDCVHYAEVSDPSPMGIRHASSLAYFNGSIVVLGGHESTAGTIVWQYFPDLPGEAG